MLPNIQYLSIVAQLILENTIVSEYYMRNLIVTCFASDSLTISAISGTISRTRDLDQHHRAPEIHGKTTHQACLVSGIENLLHFAT